MPEQQHCSRTALLVTGQTAQPMRPSSMKHIPFKPLATKQSQNEFYGGKRTAAAREPSYATKSVATLGPERGPPQGKARPPGGGSDAGRCEKYIAATIDQIGHAVDDREVTLPSHTKKPSSNQQPFIPALELDAIRKKRPIPTPLGLDTKFDRLQYDADEAAGRREIQRRSGMAEAKPYSRVELYKKRAATARAQRESLIRLHREQRLPVTDNVACLTRIPEAVVSGHVGPRPASPRTIVSATPRAPYCGRTDSYVVPKSTARMFLMHVPASARTNRGAAYYSYRQRSVAAYHARRMAHSVKTEDTEETKEGSRCLRNEDFEMMGRSATPTLTVPQDTDAGHNGMAVEETATFGRVVPTAAYTAIPTDDVTAAGDPTLYGSHPTDGGPTAIQQGATATSAVYQKQSGVVEPRPPHQHPASARGLKSSSNSSSGSKINTMNCDDSRREQYVQEIFRRHRRPVSVRRSRSSKV